MRRSQLKGLFDTQKTVKSSVVKKDDTESHSPDPFLTKKAPRGPVKT